MGLASCRFRISHGGNFGNSDSQNSFSCCAIEKLVLRMDFENLRAAVFRCGLRTLGASQKRSLVLRT